MTIMVPNTGEGLALKNFVNKEAPQDQTLKLFVNNITPSELDTDATYTEAAGGGYAAKSLVGANWDLTEGEPSDVTYNAQQVWTFTGPLTTNLTVYGYYVVQATSGTLMWAEDQTSFAPANNGDQIKVTPKLTAD